MTFSELQEIMKEQGIRSLADISRILGVSPQSVSNWKARDQVPYKVVVEIQEKFGDQKAENGNQQPQTSGQLPSSSIPNAQVPPIQSSLPTGQAPVRSDHPTGQAIHPSPIPNAQVPYYFEEDTISLTDILSILAKNLKYIIITPIITCILGIIYLTFIAEPVYSATARMLIPQTSGSASQLTALASRFGIAIPETRGQNLSSVTLYPEIVESRTFARKLLGKEFYTEKLGKVKPLVDILMESEKETLVGRDTLITQASGLLHDGKARPVEISFETEGSFHILKVEAFEARLSADIAYAVLGELDTLQRHFKSKHVLEKKVFIENRIQTVERDLEESEEALKSFRERNRQIANSPTLLLGQERLMREVETQKSVYMTLKQQYELVKIEEVQESSLVQVLDYPVPPLSNDRPRKRLTLLLSGMIGLGLGVVVAFVKGYSSSLSDEERVKMGDISSYALSSLKDLLMIKRWMMGVITAIMLIGLPFLIGHRSDPLFHQYQLVFGRYSYKALIIIISYSLVLTASLLLTIYFDSVDGFMRRKIARN